MTLFLWIIGVALVLTGIAGTVLPALPGAPLVFAGLVIVAWADGFQHAGTVVILILALLTLLSVGVDLVAGSFGAKRVGASKWAVLGALIGTVVGLFFGLPGLILGPFVGAFAGEYIAKRNLKQSSQAGLATWLGIVVGGAVKLGIVFAMIGVFALSFLL